jgi:hypothetical protein
MNITAPQHSVHSVEFEGFYYVESDGHFYKGCRRCGGTGHYSFNGSDSICYLCNNVREYRLGDEFETREAAEKWCHERAVRRAQRERKAEVERLANLNKREAAWDALEAAHPAVWALLTSVLNVRDWNKPDGDVYPSSNERNPFVLKMADQLWHLGEFSYTERMITALEDIAAKRAVEAVESESHPAPSGRVVVTGEIVSAKAVDSDFGTAYKVLVKDDQGYKVWVSLPSAQRAELRDSFDEQVQADGYSLFDFGPYCFFLGTQDGKYTGVKGRRITFTATLEPSNNDVAFAFGSRPTKGAWL